MPPRDWKAATVSGAPSGSSTCVPARWRAIRLACSTSPGRSEEHTSELQSQSNLVCRLLLEKKKKNERTHRHVHSAVKGQRPAQNRLACHPSDLCLVRRLE